ncbi:hypothetical protein [Vibrio sp. CAU 1672]|uniref:hypothetical protein n=1 Tax=Vibrio sp. CAU 1672 TaxID=3032594 RepID=UPI0023DBB4EC|nr:hypothetical protein [Vibrio sp. CAU 1672]MDF2156192.1 hypothetical protein [Vibrio sp. CAU 1672]
MVGAYCRIHDNEMLTLFQKQPKEIQEAWQIKKPWKSVNQTISKGTKRLQKRLHAYHAYAAYNQAVLDGSDKSFEEILSWCSSAYESKLSMMQDSKHRMENLKRTIHRPCRPIYHLLEGYFQEHLINNPISERHPVHALTHNNWLENAIVTARRKLASELIDYHVNKLGLQKPLKLKFEPSEIVHLELASKPFVGLSC